MCLWIAMLATTSIASAGASFGSRRHIHLRSSPRTAHWLHAIPVTVTEVASNHSQKFEKDRLLIGCGKDCDVAAKAGPNVADQHLAVELRREAVFCRALVGEDTFDSSFSWLNGTEMRPNVGYLVGSGSTVTLGNPSGPSFRIEFKESSGKNTMLEMMMQGMASGNADVAKALKL